MLMYDFKIGEKVRVKTNSDTGSYGGKEAVVVDNDYSKITKGVDAIKIKVDGSIYAGWFYTKNVEKLNVDPNAPKYYPAYF